MTSQQKMDVVHGLKTFNAGEEEEIRQRAFNLCREYLNGAWRNISVSDFVIKKIGGGLSNLLYFCALPDNVEPISDEPSRILLRLYGATHQGVSVIESHFTECVVFTMLSEKERGPRLYGVFTGGRLEQYIPGRPATTDELLDDELSSLIAENMAQIHAMSVPLSKNPSHLWNTLFGYVDKIEEYLSQSSGAEINESMVKILNGLDLRAEVNWLKSYLTSVRSPVVFCHNDVQEGNILIRNAENGEKSIVLIDYEYCGYNYRAYDLANFMVETMYDYTNEEFPYFWAKPENFPTREKQAQFVERYLCKYHNTERADPDQVNCVLEEIRAFLLAPHLFWATWSVVNAISAQFDFDYWGFGAARFASYFEHKSLITLPENAVAIDRCAPQEESTPINMEKTLSSPLIEIS